MIVRDDSLSIKELYFICKIIHLFQFKWLFKIKLEGIILEYVIVQIYGF